ncbi:MAG: peptidyl-prolyl cis-trans isomerase [Candidatus Aminicenantes bacterium]|nr:peptidyl-prolyl cis-trans isomerase [Candidatus Aminicenantes bacterium]
MRTRPMLAAAWLAAAAVLAAPAAQVIEEIVAVVNDDVITLSKFMAEWQSRVDLLRSQLQGEALDKEIEALKGEILDILITDLLLLQKGRELARDRGLDINEQVRAYIDNVKKQNSFSSDDDLRRALQQQGLSFEEWRSQLEESFLRQAVIVSEVDRTIVLDDSQIVQYYKEHPAEFTQPTEYKLRAVYLALDGRTAEELEARRREVSDKLSAGQDFEAVAKELSDAPLKETGGDLGRFKKGELETTLEQAVDKLKSGETAPWLETKNGWYLLKVEERVDSYLKPFEEVKKDVEENLFNARRGKKIDGYLKDLRESSYVKILKPNPFGL